MNTIPRRTAYSNESDERAKPRNGSLVDYRSPYFVSYLVLSSALEEMMGGSYPPDERQNIENGLWRLIVENNIPFSTCKVFADEKKASSRKRFFTNKLILDSWWENAQYTMKKHTRREP